MLRMNEVAELKVGDRVGFYRHIEANWTDGKIATITKINGYGHITVDTDNPLQFDKYGCERGRGAYGRRLIAAAALEAEIARIEAQRKTDNAIATLRDRVNDLAKYSRVEITAEIKAELAAMVAAL